MNEAFELLGFGEGGWGPALMKGAWITMQISIGGFAVGLLVGLITALAKLNAPKPIKRVANAYTTVCRAVPELLLIILLFYGGSSLINALSGMLGFGDVDVAGMPVAIVVLGLVQGAYSSEIFRGAIKAVNIGQIEASYAYGMSRAQTFWRVTLPMMAPNALAGLSNLWVYIIKDSALISVVGTNELLYTAKQAGGSTREYLIFFGAAAAIYYIITLISSYGLKLLENHLRRWQPKH
ncbi:ABC transporter permease [Vibrio hippocampi]|uniref:Octopine transport system permease protein OccQ n=1 Tax=Vibrio hippocampi TaxID=654686 RepID=A0ABN8DKL3_9VIBR|nr:ABC transporter permease subunit [Vibrio hippocampi]CAH0529864.1 Octopine transport system permease protein OccQ [Vibrio hippocampi]